MNAASFAGVMAALTTMVAPNARTVWDELGESVESEILHMSEEDQKIINEFRKLMMREALSTEGFKSRCEITYTNNRETANYTMQESIVYRIRFDEKKEVENE